jgi:hypothetical protein
MGLGRLGSPHVDGVAREVRLPGAEFFAESLARLTALSNSSMSGLGVRRGELALLFGPTLLGFIGSSPQK